MKKLFLKSIFLFCALLAGAASATVNAQTALPVTVNQASGDLSSYPWITLSNSNNTWENGYGYQLKQHDGSMVFHFSGIPASAAAQIHRYRSTRTAANAFPQVIFEASADGSLWRQVTDIEQETPPWYDTSTSDVYNTATMSLNSSDKYLRIRRTKPTGDATYSHAYLVSLSIYGYVPADASINYNNNPGNYTLNLPCVAKNVTAELWGAGGGGGAAKVNSGTAKFAAGGGGGGGAHIYGANFGSPYSISIVVGSGGSSGTVSSNGTIGGNSSVSSGSSFAQANGGGGGNGADNNIGNGGSGGSINCNVVYDNINSSNGGSGGDGTKNTPNPCSWSSRGGSGGNLNGGNGGQTYCGGFRSDGGKNGSSPGGGGGGAAAYTPSAFNSGGNASGGTGGNGNVKINFDIEIPDITITNNNGLSFCAGGSTVLTASTCDNDHTSWQWYKDGVPCSTTQSITVSDAGDYYVKAVLSYTEAQMKSILGIGEVVIFNASNLSTSKISEVVRIAVNPLPSKTDAEMDICSCEPFVSFAAENNVNYYFTPLTDVLGEDPTDDIASQILDNTTDETKQVIYSVTQTNSITGCVGQPFTLTLNVRPKPSSLSAAVEINREENKAVVRWYSKASAEEYIVKWYIDGEAVPSGSISTTATSYTAEGGDFDFTAHEYIFTVQMRDASGCISAEAAAVDGPLVHLHDMDLDKASIWTSNGSIYIRSASEKNGTLTVYSILGKPVGTMKIPAYETRSIALPKGIYLLKSGNEAVKVVI
ncbi:MAG: T9SS type A sorting domain-containing protein [Prevotellaceae bacterium]|jgi:hypothetical protein|nr:T9SS type A sorting domain-containing protein [Prevotellaceae bacterium]